MRGFSNCVYKFMNFLRVALACVVLLLNNALKNNAILKSSRNHLWERMQVTPTKFFVLICTNYKMTSCTKAFTRVGTWWAQRTFVYNDVTMKLMTACLPVRTHCIQKLIAFCMQKNIHSLNSVKSNSLVGWRLAGK